MLYVINFTEPLIFSLDNLRLDEVHWFLCVFLFFFFLFMIIYYLYIILLVNYYPIMLIINDKSVMPR
jgi:hypothetical protein